MEHVWGRLKLRALIISSYGYNEQISGDLNRCNGVYSCVRSQLMPDC